MRKLYYFQRILLIKGYSRLSMELLLSLLLLFSGTAQLFLVGPFLRSVFCTTLCNCCKCSWSSPLLFICIETVSMKVFINFWLDLLRHLLVVSIAKSKKVKLFDDHSETFGRYQTITRCRSNDPFVNCVGKTPKVKWLVELCIHIYLFLVLRKLVFILFIIFNSAWL